jgi:hypothetical protein
VRTPNSRFYHATTDKAARAILRHGFKDATGCYMTAQRRTGVWLSNVPLDVNEGTKGNILIEVTLDLSKRALAKYEWIEEGKPYREWLMPAALINPRTRRLRIVDQS